VQLSLVYQTSARTDLVSGPLQIAGTARDPGVVCGRGSPVDDPRAL